MKIKMLISMAGPNDVRKRGDEIEASAEEAARLVDAGFAELVRDGPAPEKAVKRSTREKAVK